MINETLLISDANIFFDLIYVDLLSKFFELNCKIYTTNLIIDEIKYEEQQKQIETFIVNKMLYIKIFNNLFELQKIKTNTISIADASVLFCAKELNGILLSGDKRLKKVANNYDIKVSGILYIFKKLVDDNIISKAMASQKLKKLMNKNTRLPIDECKTLISLWTQN